MWTHRTVYIIHVIPLFLYAVWFLTQIALTYIEHHNALDFSQIKGKGDGKA